MSERSPSDYVARFDEELTRLGVVHCLAEALAAVRYRREPRFTTDVDFLARPGVRIDEHFRAQGYDVRTMVQPGEAEPFVYFIRGDGVKVDVIVAETDYQELAIERAVDGALSREDVIVHKLLAWRLRDQDDIRSILELDPVLDEAYIEHWAGEWDVPERWVEARTWR